MPRTGFPRPRAAEEEVFLSEADRMERKVRLGFMRDTAEWAEEVGRVRSPSDVWSLELPMPHFALALQSTLAVGASSSPVPSPWEVMEAYFSGWPTTRVQGLTSAARRTLLDALARAVDEGLGPRRLARELQSVVPLSPSQAQALRNYRSSLLAAGVSLGKVARMVDAYRQRAIRQRALTVARTEVSAALNAVKQQTYVTSHQSGLLPQDALKVWIATPGERTCPTCMSMDGVQVPVLLDFTTPNGPSPGPPLHANCRCTTGIV